MDWHPHPQPDRAPSTVRRPNGLTQRWVGPEDEAPWMALFARCFAWSMPRAQWLWKYRDAAGQFGLGLFRDEKLLAFYGGMPRRLEAEGKAWAGIQIGDVMVDPAIRGGLSRGGAFKAIAASFLAQTLGPAGPFDLGFGFPNHRAMRLAVKLGLYREVDQVVELSWPNADGARTQAKAPGWPRWRRRCEPANPQELLARADAIWAAMPKAFDRSILGRRDSAFLRARYLLHPTHRYDWFALRSPLSAQVQGIAVCRKTDARQLEILDLIAHPEHFPRIAEEILRLALGDSLESVFMWASRSHVHLFNDSRPTIRSIDVAVPTCNLLPGRFPSRPDGRWWLTGGDTDFR